MTMSKTIPTPFTDLKPWQRKMYYTVKKAAEECQSDIVNLYIKLERDAKEFINNGQMKEGDKFKVPLENGISLELSFYKEYSTVTSILENGERREAISKQDSYKQEYRYLYGMSDALEATQLGIGIKFPTMFQEQLKNAKPGEVFVFENNESYVCKYNFPEFISLVKTHGLEKTPKIEDFDSLESIQISHRGPLEAQWFYRGVADPYTGSVKYKATTLDNARAVLNTLLINKGETKQLTIGPNKFVVHPSKDGRNIVFFDQKGTQIPEDRMLFMLGWLEAAPNRIEIKRPDKEDPLNYVNTDLVMEAFENSIKQKDFTGAAELLFKFSSANDASFQINMSTYEKTPDGYHAVSYDFVSKDGVTSIKKISYENDDFAQNPISVTDASIEDVAKYLKERYNEAYIMCQNSYVRHIMDIHNDWQPDKIKTLCNGAIQRLFAQKDFLEISSNPIDKETESLINGIDSISKENEHDER